MAGLQDSSQLASQELPLPAGFQTIESVLDFSAEKIKGQPLVNVIGVVRDYQPPMQTNGPDHKCTITIVDASTQYNNGIKANIFGPLRDMPHISNSGDIVILRAFKVQSRGSPSLLKHYGSGIDVFHVSKIPSWPCSSSESLPTPSFSLKDNHPSIAESAFITWLSNFIDKSGLPDEQTFQVRVQHAAVLKEKFSLLKDVKAGNFYDIIGEVRRKHLDDDKATIYLSDYTANSLFYNNVWGGNGSQANSRDGDVYGYVKSKPKATNDWPGPYGKLSIQLTLWGCHREFIEVEKIKVGDWLHLKNVHVKTGNMAGCLEGAIHEDRLDPNKLCVWVLPLEDRDSLDVRCKDAIRRKRAYEEKEKKKYLEEAAEESTGNGKRESDLKKPERLNSKKRRKMMRETAQQKPASREEKVEGNLDLNANVRCNHADKPTIVLDKILTNHEAMTPGTEHKYLLPFVNTKCRASVRIVDYWPHKLEDFSVGRRVSEYDMLSDYSGGESTDREEDLRQFRDGNGYGGKKTWEWRFALQVEQAGNISSPEKIWLVVDNSAAQMLLNQDAVDLHHDKTALCNLREVIFTLWGDLEEKKSAFLKTSAGNALLKGDISSPTPDPEQPKRPYHKPSKAAEELPPDSDDETEKLESLHAKGTSKPAALADRDPNAGASQASDDGRAQKPQTLSAAIWALPVANKGFTCCIQQYGIKVAEDDEAKADAGERLRWQRMFGLFGTMIDRGDDE